MPRPDGKPTIQEILDSIPPEPTLSLEQAQAILALVPESAYSVSGAAVDAALAGHQLVFPQDTDYNREATWFEFLEAWFLVHNEGFPRKCRGCPCHENGPHKFGCSIHGAYAAKVPASIANNGKITVSPAYEGVLTAALTGDGSRGGDGPSTKLARDDADDEDRQ